MSDEHYLAKISAEISSIRRFLEDREVGGSWLSAEEVSQRLGVSRNFVYDHREELGGYPISSGSRPRLRFDSRAVDAFIRSGPTQPPKFVGPRAPGCSVELLPVKDD